MRLVIILLIALLSSGDARSSRKFNSHLPKVADMRAKVPSVSVAIGKPIGKPVTLPAPTAPRTTGTWETSDTTPTTPRTTGTWETSDTTPTTPRTTGTRETSKTTPTTPITIGTQQTSKTTPTTPRTTEVSDTTSGDSSTTMQDADSSTITELTDKTTSEVRNTTTPEVQNTTTPEITTTTLEERTTTPTEVSTTTTPDISTTTPEESTTTSEESTTTTTKESNTTETTTEESTSTTSEIDTALPLDFPENLPSCSCPTFSQIRLFLEKMAEEHPLKVKLVTRGYYTHEGRPIIMAILRPYMQRNVRNGVPFVNRKSYWLDGGLEANACDTVTMLLMMIKMMVTSCPQGYCHHDYYIVPLVNPDGYEYARLYDSSWVKNRQPNFILSRQGGRCDGVRINYNFPPNETFSLYGSPDPCSLFFRGEHTVTTREAGAIIKFKMTIPNLALATTFITHKTPYLLWPKDYSSEQIPEYANYKTVAYKARVAMNGIAGFSGPAITPYHWLSPQSGTEMGYGYVQRGDAFSFTFGVPQCVRNATIGQRAANYGRGLAAMVDATADIAPDSVIPSR